MEESKSCLRIRIKFPKRTPPLTDSDDGLGTAHNEGKPACNGDAGEIANVEYPKSTTPTCPECGRTLPSNKSLFGHLRCHPQRSYRGAHSPPMATKKRHYSVAHDSATKPTPSAPKWPTRKRNRAMPVDIEDDGEEAAAARIMMQISKDEPVVIMNGLKTSKGNRIIKKKKMEESEQENVEPGACGTRHSVCMTSFSSHQALGGHKAGHRKSKNTNPKEAAVNTRRKQLIFHHILLNHLIRLIIRKQALGYLTSISTKYPSPKEKKKASYRVSDFTRYKEKKKANYKNTNPKNVQVAANIKDATHDPKPSAHSSNQTDHKKACYRVFNFDLNEIPWPEGEES